MIRLTGWLLLAVTVLLPGIALAQPSGPLRVYVFRTGDDASDQAAAEALRERGHQVTLGVRAAHLLFADVRLSDYHAVVLAGRERESLSSAVITALTRYVQSSGGLLVDGQAFYHLRGSASTLQLAADHCGYYTHSQTTFGSTDPPVAVMHDQVPSSFGITLTQADGMTEQCLRVGAGASTFFHSRAEGEARTRPAVAGNEPGPNSRSIVVSVAIRERELRNQDLRRTFVNAVEWVGAKTQATDPATAAYVAQPRRVYVLRTGEDASDQAVYDALIERGHQVSMGVRVSQLSSSVPLAGFEAVVALGAPREPVSTTVVGLLSRYVQAGGGLLVDGQMMYHLRGTPSITLGLPATHCGYYAHGSTTVDRIDPAHGIIHDSIAPSFDLPLLQLDGMTEQCLSPAARSKMLVYSRTADGSAPRPAMLVNESDQSGRIATLAFGVRYREMLEPNFRRLLVNTVEWVAKSTGGPIPNPPQPGAPLKVYVLRSGDESSDTAIQEALMDNGHTVSMGVRTHEVTATTPLSDYQVVVAAGVERAAMPAAAVSSLGAYLERGGRLVLDGLLLYALRGRPVTTLNLPAEHCGYYAHRNTIYQRIDPPDPLMHTAIPPAFGVALSVWDGMTEQCLAPIEGARLMFYSRPEDEPRPRPGVVANEPTQSSKAVQFSVAFRQRELQTPDFRRLFLNAVDYAGGIVIPPSPIRVSPDRLSFLFRNSADFPRSQTIRVTPTSLNATTFTATVTDGAEWMTVGPSSAAAPADISVRVTPVSLPPGTVNGEVTLRSGSTSIAVPVTVTVSGTAPCTYEISPSSVAVPATGGTHRIGILTPPGCTWTAASNSPWISVVSGSSGAGSGTVSFAVAPSASLEPRTGSLTVAGHSFMVAQAGMSLSFRLDSAPLDLRFTEGSEEPETRIISIIPSTSNPPFAASTSGESWLAVTPGSGTAPGTIALSVNPRGLSAGTYRSVVAVQIPTATPAEQTIPVTLTIEPRPAPQFHIEPTSLTLSATEGSEPKTERFIVSNPGTGALTFQTAISEAPWLSVEPASGSVTTGSPVSVVVTGDPRGLQPGSYSGRIVVSSSTGEEVTVNVVMTVTAARQSILLSQAGLTYTAVAQGGGVPSQNFGVLNIGSGVMDWSASASTLSGGSWLMISRTTGTSAADSVDVPLIDVGVNGASLAPGEYHGRITITSPTASNSPQIVSVILNVLPPGSDPGPVVRPTGLIFITQEGGPAASPQEVSISNLTSEERQFNSNRLTTDNTVWFTHSPAQATVTPAQPARVSVQSSGSGLTAGVRLGVLTMLFSNGSVQHVNVLNIVAPRTATPAKNGVRHAGSCSSDRLVLAHTALRPDFSVATGQGVRIEVKASDTCGNLLMPARGASAFVSAGFSNGDPSVSLVHIGGGVWSGTWRPVRAAARVLLTITAMYLDGTAVRQKDQITLSGAVRDSSRSPIITAGGLQHAASFEQGVPIAPGTLITLKGFNLADDAASGTELPLPRELNGVEVLLGDRTLPLLYVSNTQLNVQVPFNLPANTQHQISVRRGDQLSVPESVTVTETVPGIFTVDSTGSGQGVIYKSMTGTLADSNGPASPGETVVLYCTGLGAVNASVLAGDVVSGDPPQVPAQLQVRIGDQQAQVVAARLTLSQPGVYEVHAVVPEGVPSGDNVPVTITAEDRTSPPVTMAVR